MFRNYLFPSLCVLRKGVFFKCSVFPTLEKVLINIADKAYVKPFSKMYVIYMTQLPVRVFYDVCIHNIVKYLWNLRLSQRCWRRFESSGKLEGLDWQSHQLSKKRYGFIFRAKQSNKSKLGLFLKSIVLKTSKSVCLYEGRGRHLNYNLQK
jgi:hypothetical protein